MAGNPILDAMGNRKNEATNDKAAILQQAKALMNGDNPMMNAVRMLVGRRNPKDVFYEECRKQGVNPDDILSMLQ